MALEDFTTYTEVDGGADITVGVNKVEWVNMLRNVTSYVYKDFTAGYFGAFEHDIELQCNNSSEDGTACMYAVSNSIAELQEHRVTSNLPSILLYMYQGGGGSYAINFRDCALQNQDGFAATVSTLYYVTVARVGTTATAKFYSDAARTVLLDTLTITCATTTYRYAYATMSHNSGNVNTCSGFSQNFDFGEAATGASIYYNDGTGNIELQKDNSSPVQMFNGVEIIGLKLGETSDLNASPMHVFDGTNVKAILRMP